MRINSYVLVALGLYGLFMGSVGVFVNHADIGIILGGAVVSMGLTAIYLSVRYKEGRRVRIRFIDALRRASRGELVACYTIVNASPFSATLAATIRKGSR